MNNDSAANSSDTGAVSIFFADTDITELFAALLEAHGVTVAILSDLAQATVETKIITEVKYFPRLTPDQANKALIVGRKSALRGIPALCLAQPLTEEGVMTALERFLEI